MRPLAFASAQKRAQHAADEFPADRRPHGSCGALRDRFDDAVLATAAGNEAPERILDRVGPPPTGPRRGTRRGRRRRAFRASLEALIRGFTIDGLVVGAT